MDMRRVKRLSNIQSIKSRVELIFVDFQADGTSYPQYKILFNPPTVLRPSFPYNRINWIKGE